MMLIELYVSKFKLLIIYHDGLITLKKVYDCLIILINSYLNICVT